MSGYIRGALPAIAGGCARVVLSEALSEEPALPAPEGGGGGESAQAEAPAWPPGGDVVPLHGIMDMILRAAVESASALWASGDDAADAAVGLALDSIGEAFLNATVGTEAVARAGAAGQDGPLNGIA